MTVRELILALQQLPEDVQDSSVSAEYTECDGPLDVFGHPVEVCFYSVRTDTTGRGKRKRHTVVLY